MIYEIHKNGGKPPHQLEPSSLKEQQWREKKLEDYLFQHLRQFVSVDLMVIGQSSPGEKADLVALDQEGELWLFELKKIEGKAENLLQVMRYSQIFGALKIDDLDKLYRDNHEGARDSLAVAFCNYFGYDPDRADAWGEKLAKRHHLVVMADGADDATLGAVAHWQRHGLAIQAWPYRIHDGNEREETFYIDLPELLIEGKRISRKPAPVFFVNTSRKKKGVRSEMENYMIKHECALTTGGERWISKILNIPAGAKVMLYANQIGVIAKGIATPARRKTTNLNEFNGDTAHFLKLREFRELKQPLSVQNIFKAAGKQYRVSSVYELLGDAGKNVWEAAIQQP